MTLPLYNNFYLGLKGRIEINARKMFSNHIVKCDPCVSLAIMKARSNQGGQESPTIFKKEGEKRETKVYEIVVDWLKIILDRFNA